MEQQNYVGVDWSLDQERSLGIYVTVRSKSVDDVSLSPEEISKDNQRRLNLARKAIRNGLDYRFFLLEENRKYLQKSVLVCGIVSLILNSMDIWDNENCRIFIDGNLNNNPDMKIARYLNMYCGRRISRNRIKFMPRGDSRYPILNIADAVAYKLLQLYRYDKTLLDRYGDKRVFPNDNFIEFIEKLKR